MIRPQHILRSILALLMPSNCSYCRGELTHAPVPYLCSSCWDDLARMTGPVCPVCGRPFASPESLSATPEHLCRTCRAEPPHFDQALAAGLFEGQLREAIHLFKYRPVRALARPLSAWMTSHVRLTCGLDIVMPVPLHRKRLRQRGFNQALLLGKGVSEAFGLPLSYDNLQRIRHTRPQVELSGRDRAQNVHGAFQLRRPDEIQARRVLLVDDVFTSGATMNECARTLKEHGAAHVIAFTLARTGE